MTRTVRLQEKADKRCLTEIADHVLRSKRVVFLSGAGISCSAGIPDFRSMDGLYAACPEAKSTFKGKDLFDVSLFSSVEKTATFYRFMAGLRASTLAARPTPTHRFLRSLKDRGVLLRTYTQNIDGLERGVGLNLDTTCLKRNDAIQLHGDIHLLRCTLCSQTFEYDVHSTTTLEAGLAPACPSCADKCAIRVASGRRSVAIGTLRPDIVLYGEHHPSGDTIASACAADLAKRPDCLIVAGTSLKVPGFKCLVKDLARAVHAAGGKVIFVNLTRVGASEWADVLDYHVEGSSDDFVDVVRASRPALFARQQTLDAVMPAAKPMSTSTTKRRRVLDKENLDPRACGVDDDAAIEPPAKRRFRACRTAMVAL